MASYFPSHHPQSYNTVIHHDDFMEDIGLQRGKLEALVEDVAMILVPALYHLKLMVEADECVHLQENRFCIH
jgi:hypothetical protein